MTAIVGSTKLAINQLLNYSLGKGQEPKFIALGTYEYNFIQRVARVEFLESINLVLIDMELHDQFAIVLMDKDKNKLCMLHGEQYSTDYTLETYDKPEPPQKLSIPLVVD